MSNFSYVNKDGGQVLCNVLCCLCTFQFEPIILSSNLVHTSVFSYTISWTGYEVMSVNVAFLGTVIPVILLCKGICL